MRKKIILIIILILIISIGASIYYYSQNQYCGTSTKASCETDSDCKIGGCSGQICGGEYEEDWITDCMWKDCYGNKGDLTCKCVEGKCMWG